jgi:hypothetical protein
VEARLQLPAPLLPQSCRRDDEDTRVRRSKERFRDDEPCLDRLAKSHVISDQHAAGIAARNGNGGFELKWQHGEIGPGCRSQ